jgi:monoamine oxidase
MALSRRNFIRRVGAAGGYGAAFAAMQALGFIPTQSQAALPSLPADFGKGVKVAVLGAGISGLVTTFELERAGFEVVLVEARDRVGGRNWSVRNGTKIEMIGEPDQVARFSEGHYFNAGPARLPSHHRNILGYCQRLGVALEVEVNTSRSSRLQADVAFGGKPIEQRQAINDTRGALSELLAKATNRGALDQDLAPGDKERLLAFLRGYGDLAADMTYQGSERSGLAVLPGAADQVARKRAALKLHDLLGDPSMPMTLFEEIFDMQATMFEPVGGMDRIPMAIGAAIKSPILKGAEVRRLVQGPSKAEVHYVDRASGTAHRIEADHLIVTLPLPVLAKLDVGVSAPYKAAIARAVYDVSAKVAFESPRFWEAEGLYGGLSFPAGDTGLVWYPSSGYFTPTGVIIAAYTSGSKAKRFQSHPIAEQIELARGAVERLHPGHGKDLGAPAVVNWTKVPYSLGPWSRWGGPAEMDPEGGPGGDLADYALLNQPDGRIWLTGAHLSQEPGWQEGGIMAAHRTIAMLSQRVRAAAA